MVVRRLVVSLSLAVAGVLLPIAASYAADPSDLYAATGANGGDDAHDCTLASPCASVQRAVDLAAASGTTIHVGAGTFSGEIELGTKSVSIDGAAPDDTTLTKPQESGDVYVLLVTSGTANLSNLTVVGGLFVDVFVLGGTVEADHVVLGHGGCGLVVNAGQVDLTDSTVHGGGHGCLTGPGVGDSGEGLVRVNGGDVSLVRSQVLDPDTGDPAVSITGGTVTADQTFFQDSANDEGNAGVEVTGGAASVTRSTLTGFGAGVSNDGGTTSLSDDTFFGNVVGVSSSKGAATVVRSTFQDELASLQRFDTGTLGLVGSVMGVDSIDNCNGTISDLGYNVAEDDTCGLSGTSQQNVDANLDPGLTERGGKTETVGILNPSPAVDLIPVGATFGDDDTPLCSTPGATDLRGVPRLVGDGCDAGSMEMAETVTTLTAPGRAAPGKAVDLEATVDVPDVGVDGIGVQDGAVTFRDGERVLCESVPVLHGDAACPTAAFPAGPHHVTASYEPAAGTVVHASTSARTRVLVGTAPRIKGPGRVRVTVGKRVSVTLGTTGNPMAKLTVTGKVAHGLLVRTRSGKVTVTGRPQRAAVGKHVLRVRATNLVGQDRRRLTIVVRRP